MSQVYGKHRTAKYESEFEKLEEHLYYRPQLAQEKLDSLTNVLTISEREIYEPYIQYVESFLAYQIGNYNKSLTLVDSALESFLYEKQDEWIARSLMLIAYNAEMSMLLDNAEKAYRMAISYTDDNRLLGLAYAGLARVEKYRKAPFVINYNKAKKFLVLVDSRELFLYMELLDAWFYPESVTEKELLQLTNDYASLDMCRQLAVTHKLLAAYHKKNGEYSKALWAISQAIEFESSKPSSVLSNLYYCKAKIAYLLSDVDQANSLCNEAISINAGLDIEGLNYYVYGFLSRLAKLENKQDDLIYYLEKRVDTHKIHSKEALVRVEKYVHLFGKVEFIQEELRILERRYFIIALATSVLFLFVVGFVLFRFKRKKKNYQFLIKKLKKDNISLQKNTIDLLARSKKRDVQQKLLASLHHIEQKINADLSLNEVLPDSFLDEYTNMLLLIEQKMNHLTESEKRYAALFALGIPQKEISKLLNVEISTVKSARTRLRIALGITNSKLKTNDYLLNQLK